MLRTTKFSKKDLLSIGAVAKRTGLAVSAIRFYESKGLIDSERSGAGNRLFERSTIRRVSFISICQSLGYSLDEIDQQLKQLPAGRTPTSKDWQKLATSFSVDIEKRIEGLKQLQTKLDGCIGCGCLSLTKCELYNPEDKAKSFGTGPRYLLGDSS